MEREPSSLPRAVRAVSDWGVFLIGRDPTSPPRAVRATRAVRGGWEGGEGVLNGEGAFQGFQGCQGYWVRGRFEWGGSPSFLLELLEAGGVLDGEGALLPPWFLGLSRLLGAECVLNGG